MPERLALPFLLYQNFPAWALLLSQPLPPESRRECDFSEAIALLIQHISNLLSILFDKTLDFV
ncbi:hypothetical protein ACOKW7_08305 [Limnospira platensis CENA597]|uniref:hypothetical protein n=1 Tax=Limnospira platensis TaxID=118562 RepID=UPI003D6F400D